MGTHQVNGQVKHLQKSYHPKPFAISQVLLVRFPDALWPMKAE